MPRSLALHQIRQTLSLRDQEDQLDRCRVPNRLTHQGGLKEHCVELVPHPHQGCVSNFHSERLT